MGLFLCYNITTNYGGKHMAYNKHTWTTQELITTDKLNNIEDGLSGLDNSIHINDDGSVELGNLVINGNFTSK